MFFQDRVPSTGMGLIFSLTFAEAAQIFKRADDALGFSLTDLVLKVRKKN